MSKLITLVHPSLSGGPAVAQAQHAVLGLCLQYPTWLAEFASMNVVILQPRPEQWEEGEFLAMDNYIWREPDMNNMITAVSINPHRSVDVARCRKYPLMRP